MKDFYLDDFGVECFASNLESHIGEATRSLRLGDYRFSEIRPIAIPKGPNGTRPGSTLSLRDRVTLWSIVSLLAPKLDDALVEGVLSFRLRQPRDPENLFEEMDEIVIPFLKGSYINSTVSPFSSWYYNWRQFDKLSKEAFAKGYRYLAVTDISAYFENINLDILRDLLISHHPNDHKIVNLLIEALCSWTVATPRGHKPKRGIPQGTGISSFLGNVFLMPVDSSLTAPGWTADSIYLRYMDDIRVFCRRKVDASKAILRLESSLRDIHLSVQTAKTKVLGADEIKELLFDDRIDQIKRVRDLHPTTSFAPAGALAKLTRVGQLVPKDGEAIDSRFEVRKGLFERATRMWMNSVMFYGSISFIKRLNHVVVKNADPRYSEIYVRAAKKFPNFPYDRTAIYSYLDSDDNIYEYHECVIIEAFRYMSRRSGIMFRRCMKILKGENSYNLKLAAIRYLAKWPMSPIQIREIERIQRREQFTPCIINYVMILAQMNGVDFSLMLSRLARIPNAQGVDVLEFVKRIQQYSSFTRGFFAFVFDNRNRFRLNDWVGVLWIISHTRDTKLKRHLAGLARRRVLTEVDTLLATSLQQIGGRLR
ncbi:reverse transcriptase domain-containing protein [Mesorhizobium sp. B2-1-5]|uniref:reverse transcriptase domain-containing protein n=1 Tax=Mesorhizobium sp. B2-1-5 TaxID=2589969 RepID=UPI0011268B4B|nr:reverse transcriptase domain-containing protein [Mesorhizobium sp. B2-1-5]TPN03028.1 hypothetical protein FJ966_01150 [Mesorhizobium sp. B2-1-5]